MCGEPSSKVRDRAAAPHLAAGRPLAALAALLGLFAAGCNDGRPPVPKPIPIFPEPVPVDTRLADLDGALDVTVSSVLVHPVAIVAVPKLPGPGRSVTNKEDELVEGAVLVADVTSTAGAGAGMIRQVLDDGAKGVPNDVRDYVAIDGAAPAALAIDLYDAQGKSGRVWVAAGRSLRVFSGNGTDQGANAAVEQARFDLGEALLPAGETLTALVAAGGALYFPAGDTLTAHVASEGALQLFAASQTRVLLIKTAATASASTVTAYLDLGAARPGDPIATLAAGPDGALWIARGTRTATGTADPSFLRIEKALFATDPAAALEPVPITLGALAGMSVNSVGDLIVADPSGGGTFGEYTPAGALVTATAAPAFGTLGPIHADTFISRLLYLDLDVSGGQAVRSLANTHLDGGVQPILSNRCVGCHGGAAQLGGLDLFRGSTYGQTVGIEACESYAVPPPGCPPRFPYQSIAVTGTATPAGEQCQNCPFPPADRIAPADPPGSYLFLKVIAAGPAVPGDLCSADVCGERMPPPSSYPRALRRSETEILRAWILRGAPDD